MPAAHRSRGAAPSESTMAAMSTVAARAEVPWPRDAGKCRVLKPEAPDRREGVSQGRVRMRGGEGGAERPKV